jgi:hypothetical protein
MENKYQQAPTKVEGDAGGWEENSNRTFSR